MKTKHLLITLVLLVTFLPFTNAGTKLKEQDWDRREHEYISKDSFSSFIIKHRGKITVSDDDKEVTAISPNGYLRIKKASFGNDRAIEIKSDSNGKLEHKYYEGGREQDFEPDGQEWLSDILYDVIRKSGIGGKERILRIYNDKGLSGALNEVDKVHSKNVEVIIDINIGNWFKSVKRSNTVNIRNMYMKALVDNIQFNDFELIDYMKALKDIVSNSTKGTILRTILGKYDLDMSTMEQFLETTASLSYNTERGNTLRAFIAKYDIDRSNYHDFFEVINGMEINSEKGNVLKPLLKKQKLDKIVLSELLKSVEQFTHSAEKAAVLRAALPQAIEHNLSTEFIQTTHTLGSSYSLLEDELQDMIGMYANQPRKYTKEQVFELLREIRYKEANTRKTPVLRKIHTSLTNDPEVINAYFDVIRSMDNEMCKYNVLLDLINVHELDKEGWLNVLDETENIARSTYYHGAAAVLREAFYKMPHESDLIEAYFDALDDIENDHNSSKEELIRMFCEQSKPSKETIAFLLKTARNITVDIEKATSLIKISKVMPKNNKELKILFENVAEEIESDYEYERLIKSI